MQGRYPTRNGIAVPVHELSLPESWYGDNERYRNNHHSHFTSKKFGQLAVTQCLRDLERHQYAMPVDVHRFLHDNYGPPEMPTEEQAAREIVDAYECGERFKRWDHFNKRYFEQDIPQELVDQYIAKYGLQRALFFMAAD